MIIGMILSWSILFLQKINHTYKALAYNVSSSILLFYQYLYPVWFIITEEGIYRPPLLLAISLNGILYNSLDIIRILIEEPDKYPFIIHHLGCIGCIASSLLNANYQEMYKFYLLLEVSSVVYNAKLLYPAKKWLNNANKLTYLTMRPMALYVGAYTLRDEVKRYPNDFYSAVFYIIGYTLIAIFTLIGIKIALYSTIKQYSSILGDFKKVNIE